MIREPRTLHHPGVEHGRIATEIADWVWSTEAQSVRVRGVTRDEARNLGALGGLAAVLIDRRRNELPHAIARWLDAGPPPPNTLVVSTRHALRQGFDVLADAYTLLVASASRRHLGTFFTPPAVVHFMVRIASELLLDAPRQVVDPGAGVGAFTVAAQRRWPRARIAAIDVNIVTLGLLLARCSVQRVRVDPVLDDYLKWIRGDGAADDWPGARLYLGNPPYTRHHDLTPAMRKAARRAASTLLPSGMPGLSSYFLAATVSALRTQDALVFVLPSSWTESRYARSLLEEIDSLSHRKVRVYEFADVDAIFPDAMVHAMIVAIGPQHQRPASSRNFMVRLGPRAVRVIAATKNCAPSNGVALENTVMGKSDRKVVLADIAKVRRGTATGGNAFFFLTDAQRAALPASASRPAILRLRHCKADVLDTAVHASIGARGERRWLLWLTEPPTDRALLDYLAVGSAEGIPQRNLPRKRPYWYSVERVAPPDIIISPMSKEIFRAVFNAAKVVPSNAMYGIYLRRPDNDGAKRLTRWLNSAGGQSVLRGAARRYGNGLYKLEPRAMQGIAIPRIARLMPAAPPA